MVTPLFLSAFAWSCRLVSVTSQARCHGNELPASLTVFILPLSSHHLLHLWSLVCVCPRPSVLWQPAAQRNCGVHFCLWAPFKPISDLLLLWKLINNTYN